MVSRKNIGEASGWLTQPHIMAGKWIGNEVGSWIKGNNERVEAKSQAPMMNNYKSNLNLTTYNPRYPYFDEEDYKKLEQGAINRGLTGNEKTQFMDEAYQYYYPQVLNQHGLNARAEEINKSAAENGEAILNGDKNVAWNMKLVDLSQTAKRVKGIAYDYPDNLVIESMKNNIPDGEQLLLNYLNDGDDTLLYKAGLKKTDAQTKMEEYNKKKENINRVLVQNWKELSDDGLKYLRDYNVMFQVVDEARVQGLGQGMSDNELLLNLIYQSPELHQLEKELDSLQLDKEDEAILGITDNEREKRKNEKSNSFRDRIGLNSDSPATLEDLAEEIYVRENMDGQTWKNFQANWRNWGDSLAKFGYRAPRDYRNFAADTDLARFGAKLFGGMTDEEVEQRIQDIKTKNINEVKAFNEMTDKEQEAYKKKIGLDPIIENYYNNQGLVESLLNDDARGFGYKSAGDVAGNVDMLAGIGASIINPALGLAIMGTDTFARENQEAFDSLIDAQTKQGVSYEDAYDSASKGAVVVGAINTAIELGLEKVLGGVETSTAKNIKELATKNLNKEVSEMIAKRGIADMLAKGLETQARSSLEEGMEEVFQQMVQNIAASDFDPDKKISDDLWRAFESGALNPMNLLAGGSEIIKGYMENKDSINQSVMNGVNNTKTFVSENLNPQNIINNLKRNKEGGNVTTEGVEMVAPQGTETTVDETVTDMDNGAIELIDEETSAENNTNTDLAETQGGSKFWEAVSGLEDNIKEKIKRNPYAIEESRELIKNMEDNPGLDFTEYQNERYESVLDMIEEKLKQAEDKRKNDVGGLYTKLEEANAPIDTTNLKNRVAEYQARVEELGDILSSSDKAKIETILKNIQEIGDGTMDVWKVRKIADQWAKYDQGATGDGIRLIRDIRNAIDDEIMAQNSEMKEVDQAYKKAKDEIQDLRGNLTYKKTGEIKSNAVSTVKNMLNANNKKYLSTLEKYIPGITERLQAIRDSKLVYNAYTSGEGSRFVSKGRDFVTKGILAGGGYLLGGPLGAGIGYLISGKVDAAITKLARKGLKETITKETPESRAELERINKKIEENQRLEAEEKAKLRELGDRIMQKVATMDKTDAEQSVWERYLADLEQDEVIDMPEEVYDQWEEVTTLKETKTPSESQDELEMMKQHSKEENIRAYKNIQNRLAKEKDVLDNYDNYVKVGYIQNKNDPRWQYHEDSYKSAVESEKTRRSNMDELYGDWLDEVTTTPKKETTKKETNKKETSKKQTENKVSKDIQDKITAIENEIAEVTKPYLMDDNTLNLSDLMHDKKAYKKYSELQDEWRKLNGYMNENGYFTKKHYDELNKRKEEVYGKQVSTWAETEDEVKSKKRTSKKS